MKQIGLALHMYHDAHRQLPAGWIGTNPASGAPHWFGLPGWGWAARILPYMEQGAAFENLVDFRLPITDAANSAARLYAISTFRCPSDTGGKTFTLAGGGIYVGSGSYADVELATGNYIGMFGTVDIHNTCPASGGACESNGAFFLNRGTRVDEISDGLSQTLLVGERCSLLAPSTWVGVVTGGQHAPARVVGVATYPPNSRELPVHYFHNFSSYHPGATHFLTADGAVRLIGDTIDLSAFQAMATKNASDITPGL